MDSERINLSTGSPMATLSLLARITLWICFIIWAGVCLVSLASVFFYPSFAQFLGQPFNGLTRLNPWLLRLMFGGGALTYGLAAVGCLLMMKQRKKGFWLYAIPAFFLFAAALIFVFSPLNQLQLFILVVSLLIFSVEKKNMY
jgi:hypothetical protein